MEEQIETRVSPNLVWDLWKRAIQDKKYIAEVKEGEGFSLICKTFFVRMIFTHSVKPSLKGSVITYSVKIKGFFAPIVRYFLGEKMRKNIAYVLQSFVKELEHKSVK